MIVLGLQLLSSGTGGVPAATALSAYCMEKEDLLILLIITMCTEATRYFIHSIYTTLQDRLLTLTRGRLTRGRADPVVQMLVERYRVQGHSRCVLDSPVQAV